MYPYPVQELLVVTKAVRKPWEELEIITSEESREVHMLLRGELGND